MTTGATGSEQGTDAASQAPTDETAAPAVHTGTSRDADEGAATPGEPEDGDQEGDLTDGSTTKVETSTGPAATVVTTTVTTTDIVTGATTTRTTTSSGPAPWAPTASAHPHPVG